MDIRSAMKNVPRYRWFLWAAFLAAALFFVIQMDFLPGKPGAQVTKGFELLDSLMSHIRRDYLEERDPLQTAEGTYRGLVNSLDPLSAYLSKDLLAGYRARTGRGDGARDGRPEALRRLPPGRGRRRRIPRRNGRASGWATSSAPSRGGTR